MNALENFREASVNNSGGHFADNGSENRGGAGDGYVLVGFGLYDCGYGNGNGKGL